MLVRRIYSYFTYCPEFIFNLSSRFSFSFSEIVFGISIANDFILSAGKVFEEEFSSGKIFVGKNYSSSNIFFTKPNFRHFSTTIFSPITFSVVFFVFLRRGAVVKGVEHQI